MTGELNPAMISYLRHSSLPDWSPVLVPSSATTEPMDVPTEFSTMEAQVMSSVASRRFLMFVIVGFGTARSVASVSYKDVLGKTVSKSRRGTVTGTASFPCPVAGCDEKQRQATLMARIPR